jgi:hypothetical protein
VIPASTQSSSLPPRRQGRRLTQHSRDGRTDGFWGHQIKKAKSADCTRFGFQNINGLTLQNNMKSEHIKQVIKDFDFDYFGIQEINSHEKILPPSQQWKRKFPAIHTQSATNQHSTSQRRIIHGGNAHFLNSSMCLRQIEQGEDPTKLGRWIWTLLRGKQGIQVRIISGYRPVEDRSNRPHTVFSQHEFYFNKVAITPGYRNPRTAFLEDLNHCIQTWMAAGDQIILGMDVNEDIHSQNMQEWTSSLGLIDALNHSHPHSPRVATCNKNSNNTPIDGIWITPGLTISKAGMTGFGELYPDSDHRLLWIDVDNESLFGFRTPPPAKRPTESLPIRDPKAMSKYNRYVKAQSTFHAIPEKTFALEVKAHDGTFTPEDAIEYNKVLKIHQDIRKRARRKCRRFYTSNILYTDDLGKIYKRRKLWKLMELKRLNEKVDARAIRRLMRQVQETNAFALSIDEIREKLNQAIKDWKSHKAQHQELRESFELKVDQRRAHKFGTSVEAQTKQRRNTQSTRSIFHKIKQVMKNTEHASISTVEITADNGQTMECLSRESIEMACIQEGQRRFTQAKNSPFLKGSLLESFGYNANPAATEAVLNGTFQTGNDVSIYTRQFIKELQMPDCIRSLPPLTGFADTQIHSQGWKRMKARTGSSPYGPLFCDYIAGTQDPQVAEVDASLSSIRYMVGFSPAAWQKASDVMIPKKKSSHNVEKLRIIVLFDAMFNMANKRIARDMVKQAQSLGLLPGEAYGGVPGRRATTCSLNKILALDVIRQERRMATLCSNDAKSCYDRIVHTVASICMQRLGVSKESCFTIFHTLQSLQHHVRTAFGERSSGYSAVQIPLHGVGQGNGAGPAIWLAITTPLVMMLRKAGFGLKLTTPITQEQNTIACFVYVDDVDSIHCPNSPNMSVTEIAGDMQRMIDTWAGALHATGGMIEASKSYWYLIDFKWNKRTLKWEYKSIEETPSTIYLRNPGSLPTVLTRKQVWEPDQDGTLGTFIAIDGNQRMVVESLIKKVDIWADKIRSRQLTATEGWLSFKSGISMSLRHQLTTSRLTKAECRKITKKLKYAALKASGLPITYPDVLVYSPREYLGLGIPNLWHIQASLFIEQCLQFGSQKTDPTGLLLRTVIQHMKLELGVSGCPLTYPFHLWRLCATPTQFFPYWEYASENSLILNDGLPNTPTARVNDQFLMETFSQNGFSATQLKMLNLCRLYLNIYLLSDITTGDGRYIDHELFLQKRPHMTHDKMPWQKSGTPSNHCWQLWKDAILKCFTLDHHQYPFRLKQPLGAWTNVQPQGHTFISRDNITIFKKDKQAGYLRFQCQHPSFTRNPVYHRTTPCTEMPPNVIPTTVHGNCQYVRHTGVSMHIPNQATPVHEWWGVVVTSTLPLQALVQAIRHGSAIAITDGSYKDGLGTAAFTFRVSPTDSRALTFAHMTPGMTQDLTPFRAEAGGLYGIAMFLSRLHQIHDLSGGTITVACDCKGALDKAMATSSPRPKDPDFDIYMELYHLKYNTPVTWNAKWVRGHQDESVPVTELDPWALLNIDMDRKAKDHWQRLDLNRPAPFSLPTNNGIWSVWIHGQRITRWDSKTSDDLYFNAEARKHWATKYVSFHEMDFDAIRMAYRSLTLYYQLRVPKWIGRRLPVGSHTAHWKESNSPHCPRCNHPNETHLHIVRCQHPGVNQRVSQWLDNLELWLAKNHTHPDIRFGVISLLRASTRSLPWTPPNTTEVTIRNAFRQQQRLGTDTLMFGWWATGWAEAQHGYLLSISRRTTGKRWLSRLIKKQWEIAWDLWRHRMEVATTKDSFSLALAHDHMNVTIRDLYDRYSTSTYPPLQRWFQQPLIFVLQQPLSFKEDWISMVTSFEDLVDTM